MIISIAMKKGGSCKTTTASVLRATFQRSLAIDLDEQRNFTMLAGANQEADLTSFDILKGDCSVRDAIQVLDKGDFVSGDKALANIGVISPFALRKALLPAQKLYKHIILDTPPALSLATLNALIASDIVVIPMHAEPAHVQGLVDLRELIDTARTENPDLKIAGILLTQYNSRAIISQHERSVIEEIAATMGTRVFKATIRNTIAIHEAQETFFLMRPKQVLLLITAQVLLDVRASHLVPTLADLYAPITMPSDLRRAHEANDNAVKDAYNFPHGLTEDDCVIELMRMYQKLATRN